MDGLTTWVHTAKLEIDISSIGEYRTECTGDSRRTVRTAARVVPAVAAVAALVTGGVLTAEPAPATGTVSSTRVLAAPPTSIAANRAW